MDDLRVVLQAKQPGRSFAWLVSPELAERLATDLRKKGWTVTIRSAPKRPDPRED